MALLLKIMHYLDKHFFASNQWLPYVPSDNMSNTLLEGNCGQSF